MEGKRRNKVASRMVVHVETALETARGVLQRWTRNSCKFLCTECGAVSSPVAIKGKIIERPSTQVYEGVELACGHLRNISQATRARAKQQIRTDEEELARRDKANEREFLRRDSLRREMLASGIPLEPMVTQEDGSFA